MSENLKFPVSELIKLRDKMAKAAPRPYYPQKAKVFPVVHDVPALLVPLIEAELKKAVDKP